MAKKIRKYESLESLVDIFDSVKRAMVHKGLIRQPKPDKDAEPKKNSEEKSSEDKSSDKEEDSQKLEEVAQKAHEILYKVDTVFPFTLFPDTITVEREKISIAKRFFFRVATITNIPVRDLLHIEANVGPFFGSVHISSRFYNTEPFSINFLWRGDAAKLQRLLQGYIIMHERDIDGISIEKDQLVRLLNDLGVGETE